ncbi:hypothetical protein BO83DRAFT_245385 [Aspergillus eucalypticola CBS 122712]|uniref:Uncharacterized protein n=1 Tax=Aspergillus eucalypticola (strain CBS 122712 / IBT 29274) TaxID=1448314 RepID=A0A317VMY6_ASPEC|nr:uncharacterized protein BO83DRAFT_245385 [Aspergillus eucalypticola CBS 122712]PWY75686.1 hypothetical protein BO83DRAFT_245385 [Aspergillus eucalypticola CBS 122712]
MAQPCTVQISCSAPEETQLTLRAGFTDDLGINILTLQGQHSLDWYPIFRGSQRAFRLTNGGVLKVRDYVRLHFWRDGASRSEEEEFYIPLDENPNIQDIPDMHVILGLDCFLKLEDFTDSHSSLAPIQLDRQTKEQKEKQQRALKLKREQAQENANKRYELQKQRRQQRAGATGRT